MKRIFARLALMLSLLAAPMMATASSQEEVSGAAPLFINLTTDDTWSAAKAIMFAHEKSLRAGHPTAIWLNVRAVYLADKKRPSHVHGLMKASGKSIQDMLADFMADGGVVIMCQACSEAAGLTEADYIDGVVMGTWPLVESWLFRDGVSTLGW